MPIIRLSKAFHFEMAHALKGYQGPCKNIHGHSYKMDVCVWGRPKKGSGNCTQGMVIDLKALKEIVNRQVLKEFDHALVLSEDHAIHLLDVLNGSFPNVRLLPYEPTCENLVSEFVNRIQAGLPPEAGLHHIDLWETATSKASYYLNDQPQQLADSQLQEGSIEY